MPTTSSNRGLTVPTVGGDTNLWGSELNTSLAVLDAILGASLTLPSSAGLSVTLSSSQAQNTRIVVTGTPGGLFTITFPSSNFALGNYAVWNATTGTFGVLCQTTGVGSVVTVPQGSMRMVNVDGTNAQFADQPPTVLPRSYLAGFTLANSGSTALTTAAGTATDSTNTTSIIGTAFTKTNAAFAAGSGNGALGSGVSWVASTWYYVFAAIVSGSYDEFWDTSISAAHAPAGTTAFRRIGCFRTNASANITPFTHNGDEFLWLSPVVDQNTVVIPTSQQLFSVTVPPNIEVWVRGWAGLFVVSVTEEIIVYEPDIGTQAGAPYLGNTLFVTTGSVWSSSQVTLRSNTSAQLAAVSQAANGHFFFTTMGWLDRRGRDA